MPDKSLTVMIVEDHEFMRTGLSFSLKKKSPFDVIWEAADGLEALGQVEERQPDIVIMDIGMPRMDGITATQEIKSRYPAIKVIILSSRQNEDEIRGSISSGAEAYCLKDISVERLIQVIELVAEGGIWLDPGIAHVLSQALSSKAGSGMPHGNSGIGHSRQAYNTSLTEREQDVLELIVQGKSNKEIALALGITLPTTKVHVSNIIQKLAVDDRTQAAVKALQSGLIQAERTLG
ncbi:MAG: response regulator transcription factor [Vampirovibrionales bacterium]|nr:response regulator transcription factor [Vampirovibrionales bacterium]